MSTFKSGEVQFALGVPFQEVPTAAPSGCPPTPNCVLPPTPQVTADGRRVTTTATLVGNRLSKNQVDNDLETFSL